ncbi:hypothetical protein BDC45DRAFT_519327 [Circinella umbellata]|nr:hypothetical protein BDC45DRAFT_519327 [Circinella umbellata]
MKSITIASLTILGFVSNAAASISVLTPWKDISWKSGGHADVTWSVDGEDYKKFCHIQLMNGSTDNGQLVAYVTNPEAPVPCTDERYDISPLNDFSSGDYWIRIGNNEKWFYSSMFHFDGKGTIDTKRLNAPVNVLLGEPAPVIDASSSGSKNMASPTGSVGPTSGPVQSATASNGSSLPTSSKSMQVPPTPSLSSGNKSGSSSGSSGGLNEQSSSKIDDKKNNVKSPESSSSAVITQPSSWMMAGVAVLVAAMTF